MTREELNKPIHDEINEENKIKKNKSLIKFIIKSTIFIIIFFTLFYSYTTYISTLKIGVREYRIVNKKIPNSLSGLKLIHFSDLHFGSTMFNENVKEIKKMINKRKPDIVVFTGDLINKNYILKSKEQEELITYLKSIDASLGKYAIIGDQDDEKTATIFNQSDFTILRNEYELIYKNNNEAILLIGLTTKDQNIEKAYNYFKEENHNANIYTITLTHKPDTADKIINQPTDLILSGHSHNGNIRIPFINYPLYKYDGAKKYNQEYYKINNTKLYISSGLGTTNGFRLFCRPSINFYRISTE